VTVTYNDNRYNFNYLNYSNHCDNCDCSNIILIITVAIILMPLIIMSQSKLFDLYVITDI